MVTEAAHLAARIGRLAEFLASTDAVRVRIERGEDEIELLRRPRAAGSQLLAVSSDGIAAEPAALELDAIKADVVGIFRLSRPASREGDILETDRELAYVEALGIRNPVHSLGAGRVVAIVAADGAAVEYGQPLFLVDRG